jgi:hypothetical protein
VDEREQAFGGYYHLVPARELLVAVREPQKAPPSFRKVPIVEAKILSKTPIAIPVGGTATVQVVLSTEALVLGKVELNESPGGITIKSFSISSNNIGKVSAAHSALVAGPAPFFPGATSSSPRKNATNLRHAPISAGPAGAPSDCGASTSLSNSGRERSCLACSSM